MGECRARLRRALAPSINNPDLPTSAPNMKGVNFLKTMELLGLFPSNTLR